MAIADRTQPFEILRSRIDDALREVDFVDRRVKRGEAGRLDRLHDIGPIDSLHARRQRMTGAADRVDVKHVRHADESNGTSRARSASAVIGASRLSILTISRPSGTG